MRLQLLIFALLVASALAPAEGLVAQPDCCAGEARADHQGEDGSSDECPPGCDAGCACCAHATALPPATSGLAVAAARVFVTRPCDYDLAVERAPLAPEPRDRDLVPRAPSSLL